MSYIYDMLHMPWFQIRHCLPCFSLRYFAIAYAFCYLMFTEPLLPLRHAKIRYDIILPLLRPPILIRHCHTDAVDALRAIVDSHFAALPCHAMLDMLLLRLAAT